MTIEKDVALKDLTTLKAGGNARFFVSVKSEKDLREACAFAQEQGLKVFVLGHGSNTFFSDEGFDGLVIKVDILGREYIAEDGGALALVGAGEEWDAFVLDTIGRGYSGLENLSLIPGSVGGAPVQNIGAYGVEQNEACVEVRVYDPAKGVFSDMPAEECGFGYRTSKFKENPGRIITRVTYRLSEGFEPRLSYKDIVNELSERGLDEDELTPQDVRDIVIAIRQRKLPDWKELPTAGSFFKNPEVSLERFAELKKQYPDLSGFETKSGVKVSLAWIIEHVCGQKGVREGDAGVYELHALVLVNYGSASAKDILCLARDIENCVQEKTGIEVEREVRFVGELGEGC